MGLRESGNWLVREDKYIELAPSEIVPVDRRALAQFFYELRFKSDEAVEVRDRIGRELQNQLILHTLAITPSCHKSPQHLSTTKEK
jgi:hypothetical protein